MGMGVEMGTDFSRSSLPWLWGGLGMGDAMRGPGFGFGWECVPGTGMCPWVLVILRLNTVRNGLIARGLPAVVCDSCNRVEARGTWEMGQVSTVASVAK